MPIILVVAAGLRLWGINFGLPFPYHPDEPFLIDMARGMLRSGDLDPPVWDYPSVQVYSLLALMVYRQILTPLLPALSPPWVDYLLGRLLNVAYAIATVYLVFRIGSRVFNHWSGLIAAAFLGLSQLHSYNSHFLMTDVPATFFATACLAGAVALTSRPTPALYAMTGAIAGLAISTKYTVGTILLAILIAHWLAQRERSLGRAWLLLLAGSAAILAVAVTSPYAWLDSYHFWKSFIERDVNWAAGGAEGWDGDVAVTYVRWLLHGRDAFLVWLGLLGGVLAIVRSKPWWLLLIAFPLAYFATLLPWQARFERYLLPLWPFLCLLAGWAAVETTRLLRGRVWPIRMWIVTVALALAVQGWYTADQSLVFAQEDVRTTSLQWIEANLPRGSRIVREDFTPLIPADQYRVTTLLRAVDLDPQWYRQEHVQYVILSSFRSGMYFERPGRYSVRVGQYQSLLASSHLVREFRGPFVGSRDCVVDIYELSP